MKKAVAAMVIFIMAGCQQNGLSNPEQNGEQATSPSLDSPASVSVTYQSEEIEAEILQECWAPDCSEASSTLPDTNVEELTQDLPVNEAADSSALQVSTSGPDPTNISYTVLEEFIASSTSPTITDASVEGKGIELNGKGLKRFVLTAVWYEADEFAGSVTTAFNVEVRE